MNTDFPVLQATDIPLPGLIPPAEQNIPALLAQPWYAVERQRYTRIRERAHVNADVEQSLRSDLKRDTGSEHKPEAVLRLPADVESAEQENDEQQNDERSADKAELLAADGVNEVVLRLREVVVLLRGVIEALAPQSAGAYRQYRLVGLVGRVGGVGERVHGKALPEVAVSGHLHEQEYTRNSYRGAGQHLPEIRAESEQSFCNFSAAYSGLENLTGSGFWRDPGLFWNDMHFPARFN